MRTWAIAIGLAVVVSPLVTRWICLWQIPNVVLPFDVTRVIQADVPEEQNAHLVYDNVLKIVLNPRAAGADSTADPDGKVELTRDEIAQRMFVHDEQALAEYIRAGKMERAGGPSLQTATYWTDLSFHQQLRQLVRNCNILGISLADGGEIEKAWACHLANLQCSIHTEQPRLAICALIGTALRTICAEGIVHWASNPSVSQERLKSARADLMREYARRATAFELFQGEYLTVRNSLPRLDVVDFLLPNAGAKPTSRQVQMAKRAFLWCIGQPELLRRMFGQVLVNNSMELDKPLHLRRHATQQHGLFIFDLDPDTRPASGQMDAEQLRKAWDSNAPLFHISKSMVPAIANLDQARLRDSARFAALQVLFAAQEYHRNRGEFPETIEQLVPHYFEEFPFDPLDAKGAAMKYRREADGTAIVWSVGGDGVDDQGAINTKNNLDIGYQIKINRPD